MQHVETSTTEDQPTKQRRPTSHSCIVGWFLYSFIMLNNRDGLIIPEEANQSNGKILHEYIIFVLFY